MLGVKLELVLKSSVGYNQTVEERRAPRDLLEHICELLPDTEMSWTRLPGLNLCVAHCADGSRRKLEKDNFYDHQPFKSHLNYILHKRNENAPQICNKWQKIQIECCWYLNVTHLCGCLTPLGSTLWRSQWGREGRPTNPLPGSTCTSLDEDAELASAAELVHYISICRAIRYEISLQ